MAISERAGNGKLEPGPVLTVAQPTKERKRDDSRFDSRSFSNVGDKLPDFSTNINKRLPHNTFFLYKQTIEKHDLIQILV